MTNLLSFFSALIRLIRPAQWMKNAVVFAAFFFAYWDDSQNVDGRLGVCIFSAFIAVAAFCLVSSGVYAFNDCQDVVSDRLHPIKRQRPVASGEVSIRLAYITSACLCAAGIAIACVLPVCYMMLLVAYLLLQLAYTFRLKRIPLLDVFIIAVGFVLRAMAGAAALSVRISPWLLLCTFLLALFLALCKRRQEKVIHRDGVQRQSIRGYSVELLNQLIAISAASVIVTYALYTLAADTIHRFGTSRLGLTIPFVVFGIFRYLHLVYTSNEGERPEKVFLTDTVMIVTMLLYVSVSAVVFITSRV